MIETREVASIDGGQEIGMTAGGQGIEMTVAGGQGIEMTAVGGQGTEMRAGDGQGTEMRVAGGHMTGVTANLQEMIIPGRGSRSSSLIICISLNCTICKI